MGVLKVQAVGYVWEISCGIRVQDRFKKLLSRDRGWVRWEGGVEGAKLKGIMH